MVAPPGRTTWRSNVFRTGDTGIDWNKGERDGSGRAAALVDLILCRVDVHQEFSSAGDLMRAISVNDGSWPLAVGYLGPGSRPPLIATLVA